MAKTGDVIEVPWHGDKIKCPGCGAGIPIKASVKIKSGSARKAGEEGFNKPIVSTSLETEFHTLRIHHECVDRTIRGV